jgi:hypothetical protein
MPKVESGFREISVGYCSKCDRYTESKDEMKMAIYLFYCPVCKIQLTKVINGVLVLNK